jgi:adenylate cyclase
MRIPIFIKEVLITITLLLAVAVPITYQSANQFEADSRKREEFFINELAAARAKEIDSIIKNAIEKTQNIGTMVVNSVNSSSEDVHNNITDAIARDKDLFAVDVYQILKDKIKLLKRVTNEERFTDLNYDSSYIDQLRKSQNFPIHSPTQGKIEIQNSSVPKGIALFSIGIPLIKDKDNRITHIALADFSLSRLQKSFTSDDPTRILFLVDSKGNVIAHQTESLALGRNNFKNAPFVSEALQNKEPRFQKRFLEKDKKSYYIGSRAKSALGTMVIAQTPEDVILEPAFLARRQSIYITGLVISGSLFLIFIFSMTLIKPIEVLATIIKVVAKGNFSVSARRLIKSKDEVGDLAIAFDKMTEGLKERDKVKTLFSKFHGSTIAEDLMNKKIGVGGLNKEVTVFFSDIRGFTKFSESRTPEEVVEMLNEYFGIMVRIIQQNHGIVDKFIGDAIMAVWGAPKGNPRDAHNAVRACLEMRKALDEMNRRRLAKQTQPIMIGMGLHSGRAISGTIGSDERMEYTVIGDSVNMASRIEASTKAFGADLLISESTAKIVESEFALEVAGNVEVKGKSQALSLLKVIGYKSKTGEVTPVKTPYSDYEREKADKIKIA